jgi:hypothetical protein
MLPMFWLEGLTTATVISSLTMTSIIVLIVQLLS